MSLGLEKNAVRVVAHDPGWADAFAAERVQLVTILAALRPAPVIEHIGATSIRGLAAKPIVDIAIGFADGAQVGQALKLLRAAGRDYVKGANQPGMLFMAQGDPRRFHYHLVTLGSPAWRKVLAFRNYLRRHPGVAADYGALKQALAERFPNSRFDYMRYKRPMLRALMLRAFAESRRRRHAKAIRDALAVAEAERRGDGG